jgi:Predicted hydrolase of the alpha/beta superfamily
MKYIILLLITFTASAVCAQKYPEVTIPGSHVRYLTSSVVPGEEYELHILLPSGYEGATKKYPVVYVMDSQWDFPLVKCIYGEQYYDGFIPEIIVVGVTWGGGRVLRTRDYTPTAQAGTQADTGGADKFLDFMKQELFPFIESQYRADSDNRTLMGCSLGGLLTLYTLFTHSDMFTGYVAASPALGWGNGVLSKHAENFSKVKQSRPLRVYMTVGDVEVGRQEFENFSNLLKGKKYDKVRLQSKVLENTGHSGTKGETYSRGLQYIFERNQLKLTDAVLNKLAGAYMVEKDNREVQIKNEKGRLVLHAGQQVIPLIADSEHDFYSTSFFLKLHFQETNNAVNGLELATFEETMTLKRKR